MYDKEQALKLMADRGQVLQDSVGQFKDGFGGLVKINGEIRFLAVVAKESMFSKNGKETKIETLAEGELVELPLNANNAALVRQFTKGAMPTACGVKGVSVGFTDYLGIFCPELPLLFAKRHLKPVLVETSPEISKVSGQTLLNSIDMATWSVMASGVKTGYGVCVSSVKDEMDFLKALLYMYSSLGFDGGCWAKPEITELSAADLEKKYLDFPEEFRKALEASYLNVEFKVNNQVIKFQDKEALQRIVLTYGETIMHVQTIFDTYFKDTPWPLDLELDLSRAGLPLTPQAHYLLANELQRNGIKIASVCLDSRVDSEAVEQEFAKHAAIADTFGYRMSIANADFYAPVTLRKMVKQAGGKLHLKLSSILWLAVLATVAFTDMPLMQKIAAQANLPVPTSGELTMEQELGRKYAASWIQILTAKEYTPADLKKVVEKTSTVYAAKVQEFVQPFLTDL